MNTNIQQFFEQGCGRCSLFNTPNCKVIQFNKELLLLRDIILETGLQEELKWKHPCYTFNNKNIIILTAFKGQCILSFFKGVLLQDELKILTSPTENMQSTRQLLFKNIQDILEMKDVIKRYIYEAIEIEKSGEKVKLKTTSDFKMVTEFQTKLQEMPELNTAFYALTPGRQRGYLLFFAAPKQSKTIESRIDKMIPRILEGKGIND